MDRGKGRATGGRDAAAKRQYELYCSSAESLFDGAPRPRVASSGM